MTRRFAWMLVAVGLGCTLTWTGCSSDATTPAGSAGGDTDGISYGDGGVTFEDTLFGNLDGKTKDVSVGPQKDTGVFADKDGVVPHDTGEQKACAEPGGVLCECTDGKDCLSGYCVDSRVGKICTKECEGDCPEGFGCAQLSNSGTDVTFVCLPKILTLCDPCSTHKDCQGQTEGGELCIPHGPDGNDGSFCGYPCAADGGCPDGYVCQKEGLSAPQCVPESGECTCSPLAKKNELATACASAGDAGSCPGERRCSDAGLSACDAPFAAAETCNGEDDDCNGVIDDITAAPCEESNPDGTCSGTTACEGGEEVCTAQTPKTEACNTLDDDCDGEVDEATCDDDIACTDDVCTDTGNCKHPVSAGACLISGVCYSEGTANPEDPCLKCIPEVSGVVWSLANGGSCDDGNPCTKDDTCEEGVCKGAPYACDDSVSCTNDACDGAGGCTHEIAAGSCLIEGACVTAGTTKPGGACLLCAPSTTNTDWTLAEGASCDDGNPCTLGDTCAAGLCAGTPLDCSGLADGCNDGVCLGGSCQKAPKGGPCDDGNPCTFSDQCLGGACVGTPVDCSALDTPCKQGICEGGACKVKELKGPCDDGDTCTENDQCTNGECKGTAKDCSTLTDTCNVGLCSNGSCVKQPTPGPCNDGDTCTSSDACLGGVCVGVPKDCSPYTDACNLGVCSNGSCIKSPVSNPCDDGDACTSNDKCVGGTCVGTPLNCSGLSDSCNTGICSGGKCVKQPKTGACNDNDACTSGDVCSNGQCAGTPNKDNYEPNNSYIGKPITNITDCANPGAQSLTATLYPSGDVDWFTFQDKDTTGCDVEPKVTLTVPSGVDYDLCVYFECQNGETVDLSCTEGSLVSGPSAKSKGCCSTKTGSSAESVRLSPSCSWLGTGNESGDIDVKVFKKSGSPTCSSYTMAWGDS